MDIVIIILQSEIANELLRLLFQFLFKLIFVFKIQ